jgi:hypothetical protein
VYYRELSICKLECQIACNYNSPILENAKEVPSSILTTPGIAGILFGSGKTPDSATTGDSSDAVATSILHLASSYQSKASEPRLNNSVRTVGSVSQPRSLNNFKNLGKAKQALELRKVKQDEAKLLDSGIRISAVLWMAEGPGASKLTEVCFPSHSLNVEGQPRINSPILSRSLLSSTDSWGIPGIPGIPQPK